MAEHGDQQRQREQAVRNLIQQAKEGDPGALHDLVDFARIAPHWCLLDVVNTLADLLTASGMSSSQKTTIESLHGTSIYSHIEREAAINRLTSCVRVGDSQALYDLVEMAKSFSYAEHPKVIETLVDVSVSQAAPREHRAAVESLHNYPIFNKITARRQERALVNLMQEARSGDIGALEDLVRLVQSERLMEDFRIAQTLADIFLSHRSRRDQRTLIWSLRDQRIYLDIWEEEGSWHLKIRSEDDAVWEWSGETHYDYYTFREYLQKYRGSELENVLAKERK